MKNQLHVRSNVRRDLLQSAQLFRSEKTVIWEYVANGLQYVDAGTTPEIVVEIDQKNRRLSIRDNGRGMDFEGLQNFFVMHGDNIDRLAGRVGRGRFGTGKSAAFGIARTLRVQSIRGGRLNAVELTRDAIDAAGDDVIPIRTIERDTATKAPNGTVVEIRDVQLRKLDQAGVIRYIERHLARWKGRPSVLVNAHLCEAHEPPVARSVDVQPDSTTAGVIGDCVLRLRVAPGPLEPEMQGVAVFAHGVWLTTTLAGLEGQPMANCLFGEIDVPALDDEAAPVPAFDMSRSMQLNPENEVVAALLPFVGRSLDGLRREIVEEDRRRRSAAEARRLQRQADQIAAMINEDFAEYSGRLNRLAARGGRGIDTVAVATGTSSGDLLRPDEEGEPAGPTDTTGAPDGLGGTGGGGGSDTGSMLSAEPGGKDRGAPGPSQSKRKPRGGFRVEFEHLGNGEPRARYAREERVIFVNLDHPQMVAAAGGGGTEGVNFRRLAYEVAFTEYAIALSSELVAIGDFYEPSDAIFEIRDAVNRMATRAAALYADVIES